MFSNIMSKIEEPEIKELLNLCIFPDPDNLKRVIETYKTSSKLHLYGLVSENEVVGLIGYRHTDKEAIEITHLSVRPDCRGAGFGRGLILELLSKENPKEIIAETDDETLDFYRHIGFEIRSLGEKYPGVERYICSYKVDLI